MHPVMRNLRQDVTYWAPPSDGSTNDYGHPDVANGILVKARWEDRIQQIRKPSGDEVTSMAEVYVDRDLLIGGYLKLGSYVGQGLQDDAQEIQDFRKTPDLRNLGTERRAYL